MTWNISGNLGQLNKNRKHITIRLYYSACSFLVIVYSFGMVKLGISNFGTRYIMASKLPPEKVHRDVHVTLLFAFWCPFCSYEVLVYIIIILI